MSRSWRLRRRATRSLDLGGRRGLVAEPGDGPRVVLGLEEGVDELDLEAADGRGRGLQPEVSLEPVGQDVAVLGPPVRLARTGWARARNSDRSCSSVTPYKVSRSMTSRILNPTRPVSSRLILDREPRISAPACSGVTPAASRRRRNWAPSSMRRTTASTGASAGPGNWLARHLARPYSSLLRCP